MATSVESTAEATATEKYGSDMVALFVVLTLAIPTVLGAAALGVMIAVVIVLVARRRNAPHSVLSPGGRDDAHSALSAGASIRMVALDEKAAVVGHLSSSSAASALEVPDAVFAEAVAAPQVKADSASAAASADAAALPVAQPAAAPQPGAAAASAAAANAAATLAVAADNAGDAAGAVEAYNEALALYDAANAAAHPQLAGLVAGYRARVADLEAHLAKQ